MGTLQSMPEGAVERLAPLLKEARSKAEYQRVQCIWLRATLGWDSKQIAEALGWQASSVRHVQARYLQQGEAAVHDKPRGGRYRLTITHIFDYVGSGQILLGLKNLPKGVSR